VSPLDRSGVNGGWWPSVYEDEAHADRSIIVIIEQIELRPRNWIDAKAKAEGGMASLKFVYRRPVIMPKREAEA
jgi:hypothetical protein